MKVKKITMPLAIVLDNKGVGVLVKNVSKMHPVLENMLRISVGTPQENQLLLAAMQASM